MTDKEKFRATISAIFELKTGEAALAALAVQAKEKCFDKNGAFICEAQAKEIARLKEDYADLAESMIRNTCTNNENVDSMAISTYAAAIRFLASIGCIKIEHECGRRVIGRWVEPKGE